MQHPPDAAQHQLTQRDLDFTPEDGNRYEVIDGELHVTPFPTFAHQHALAYLMLSLGAHVKAQGLGKVLPAGLKVVLDEPTGVGPDLVYISTARMAQMRADGFYGAPDLIVEIISSKPQLDRYVKLRKYAAAGVPHYWIADPAQRLLEIYKLDGHHYRRLAALGGEGSYRPELFPGWTLELSELWV